MTMGDLFISYKREERDKARLLAVALESRGWSVWWDPELRAGEHFDDVIEAAIKSAACVIVLWSKLSVRSRYVKDEASYALELQKLVPVAFDDAELPLRFKGLHTIPLQKWDGSATSPALQELMSEVMRRVPRSSQERPPSEPQAPLGRSEVSLDRLIQARKSDELTEIMKRYQSRIAANSEDGEMHFRLALCYLELKGYTRAIEHFKRAVELLPRDSDAHYYYGLSLIRGRRPKTLLLKDIRSIEECLETAMQIDDRPAKYYYLAAILKYDFYLANGLSASGPSPDDLISMAYHGIQEAGEVERLLQAVTLKDDLLISSLRGE